MTVSGRTKTKQMRRLERQYGKPIETLFREWFEQGMSWSEIAEAMDVSLPTLADWRTRLGARVVQTIEFGGEA
jgi:hypothetical protein